MEEKQRFRSVEYKLYPNATQRRMMEQVLAKCCEMYNLLLDECTYRCGRCGFVMDRDRNAAINILRKGLGVETCRSDTANGQPS